MKKKIETGKDSAVIGDVQGTVGDGSVVIGATDSKGNTIINQPMAVGRGASSGPGTIAIGAGASAGSNVVQLLSLLKTHPEYAGDELRSVISTLEAELQTDEPDQSLYLSSGTR
ncbi:hypothetical protein N9260_00470 [bacterium]|nr:hypothetical protein [bacterium]